LQDIRPARRTQTRQDFPKSKHLNAPGGRRAQVFNFSLLSNGPKFFRPEALIYFPHNCGHFRKDCGAIVSKKTGVETCPSAMIDSVSVASPYFEGH
jgi:hypothetical protein